jgi:hypothetical protein
LIGLSTVLAGIGEGAVISIAVILIVIVVIGFLIGFSGKLFAIVLISTLFVIMAHKLYSSIFAITTPNPVSLAFNTSFLGLAFAYLLITLFFPSNKETLLNPN